jgi:hypothetical protein
MTPSRITLDDLVDQFLFAFGRVFTEEQQDPKPPTTGRSPVPASSSSPRAG